MGKLCKFLVLNIFWYSFIYAGFFFSKRLKLDINIDNDCCIDIKAKASALQHYTIEMRYACECMYLAAPYTDPHCVAGAYDA